MNSKAIIRAATITIVWIAIATLCSESFAGFKSVMTAVGGHHWIGKSITSIIVLSASYFLLRNNSDDDLSIRDTYGLIAATILGGLAILVFYVLHSF